MTWWGWTLLGLMGLALVALVALVGWLAWLLRAAHGEVREGMAAYRRTLEMFEDGLQRQEAKARALETRLTAQEQRTLGGGG